MEIKVCKECKEECETYFEDNSFDHGFGTWIDPDPTELSICCDDEFKIIDDSELEDYKINPEDF